MVPIFTLKKIFFLNFNYVHARVYVEFCTGVQVTTEARRGTLSCTTGVEGGCELSSMDAEN